MLRNGKNEKLTINGVDRPTHDALDRAIGNGDWLKLEAFWAWAGDTKILSDDGRPLLLFHGTSREVREFQRDKPIQKDSGWYGAGIYFTADPGSASAYAGYDDTQRDHVDGAPHLIAVYVSVKNPYRWPSGKRMFMSPDESNAFTAELIAAGFDGIVVPNEYAEDEYAKHFEVVVFNPEQVKSAIGNPGTYARNDPSMTDGREIQNASHEYVEHDKDKASRRFRP